MLDIFNDDAFSAHSLTEAINLLPYQPRRIGSMGIFTEKNPRTTTILIERKGDILSILETKPRGSGETNKRPATRRDLIPFYIPYVPCDDAVTPQDVQGIRAFGEEEQLLQASEVVNEKMEGCRNAHETTHEYHRIGAIKGIVLDGDNAASELLDLFDAFNITQEAFFFDLGGSGENVKRQCLDLIAYTEDVLGGQTYSYIHCMCGNEFFQDLVNNAAVADAYSLQTDGKFLIDQQGTGTQGRGTNQVLFGDILFENYRGKVGGRSFVEPDEAHFFPVGVPGLFQEHFGPEDTMEGANKPGQRVFARQEPKDMDKGTDIHTESSPLMICVRPKLLTKGFSGAEET